MKLLLPCGIASYLHILVFKCPADSHKKQFDKKDQRYDIEKVGWEETHLHSKENNTVNTVTSPISGKWMEDLEAKDRSCIPKSFVSSEEIT